jgi:hypothetical protein
MQYIGLQSLRCCAGMQASSATKSAQPISIPASPLRSGNRHHDDIRVSEQG